METVIPEVTEVKPVELAVSNPVQPVQPVQYDLGKLGEELGNVIKNVVKQTTEMVVNDVSKPIQVVLSDKDTVNNVKGYAHEKLPTLLRIISARLPLFLVGEAGSGKTHLVEQCAETLGLKFYCISVCAQTTSSALLGYMDANGKYVPSLFRQAYENGGVFLLDEVDNGNPNVLSVLNASISNHVCSFPDKMVAKHPDFVLAASGNTYGHGANRKYVGRLEIDGATLDRFVFVEIGYDNKLEEQICGSKPYAKLIQTIRKKAQDLKLRNIISPRASINGVKLLKKGLSLEDTLQYTVFRDMSPDVFKQLTDNKEYKKALEDFQKNESSSETESSGKKKRTKKQSKENNSEELSEEKLEQIRKMQEMWKEAEKNVEDEFVKSASETFVKFDPDGNKPGEGLFKGEITEEKL